MRKTTSFLVLVCLLLGIAVINSCKKDPKLPVLTTNSVTSITLNSGTSGGVITDNGGADITAKGVCWSTTQNPTISGSHTSDGKGSENFSSNIANLTPNTMYYIRAYATNSVGTAYGNEVSFTTTSIVVPALTTTATSAVTLTTATSGGNISADGGAAVTARGVCWATTANPSVSNDKTTNGTGTGIFISDLTGLLPATTYYLRAYATNSAGTGYGNEITFTTGQVSIPTLTTVAVTAMTQTTALSGGNITADGGGSITARGVCWATSASPTTSNSVTSDATGIGGYASSLTGLAPGTAYFVRAYATNSAGTAYGNEVTFTTSPVTVPILTTTAVSTVTQTSAATGGNITADGGGAITARGVCYATTTVPTVANSVLPGGSGTGSFVSNLTGLQSGMTYYVRAYATNSAGTEYGNEVSFTTGAAIIPTVTTTLVTSVAPTTAASGGIVTDDGGGDITDRGICYATTANPTINNSVLPGGTGTGSFTSNLSGLAPGTTYYVRAYATNSTGTAYGSQEMFNTQLADVDGNTYNTVTIGTQIWMAENLATTKLNNNTAIANVTNNATWGTLTTPAYSWYGNDNANKAVHGALYNWVTANTVNLCPSGWHVPSDGEFKTLESYLGMSLAQVDVWGWRGTDQGAEIKNTTGWLAGENGTNTSGFSLLPGGYRNHTTGAFSDLGNLVYLWTSTEMDLTRSWYRLFDGSNIDIYRAATEKTSGKYVRCLKD